jgi:hypothetical protein
MHDDGKCNVKHQSGSHQMSLSLQRSKKMKQDVQGQIKAISLYKILRLELQLGNE